MNTNDNTIIQQFNTAKGFLRSRLIYDFKPFNRQKLYNFYKQFVRSNDLCFDLGAHTGNRTLAWLRLNARVIAIEPQPLFADFLRSRFESNNRVVILQKAIADKPGKSLMHISLKNPTISTLSEDWIKTMTDYDHKLEWEKFTETETLTLDKLIQIYGIPSFCKIDVEGYEDKCLLGLSQSLPALSFEFFPTTPAGTIRCIERLDALGKYRYNWSLVETLKLKSDKWMNSDEMKKVIRNYSGNRSGDIYALLQNV